MLEEAAGALFLVFMILGIAATIFFGCEKLTAIDKARTDKRRCANIAFCEALSADKDIRACLEKFYLAE